MTKAEFFRGIKLRNLDGKSWWPAEKRDAYAQTFDIFTIRPGEKWKEAKCTWGIIELITLRYLQLVGLGLSPAMSEQVEATRIYLHEMQCVQEEMYEHFLKEYNNKVEDVIIWEPSHAKEA